MGIPTVGSATPWATVPSAPPSASPLLGVAATSPWSWTGNAHHLEDQVRKSIKTTLNGEAPTDADVEALTAFLRSLPPPLRPSRARPAGDAAIARGRDVFARECINCHAPPHYTSAGRYDVGLTDEVGNRRFNPPSLRGVGQRERLLHDARADSSRTSSSAITTPGTTLNDRDIDDLIDFLKTL